MVELDEPVLITPKEEDRSQAACTLLPNTKAGIRHRMSASCPICNVILPFSELEWHVNIHFDENEIAKDMELAQQVASTLMIPTSLHELGETAIPYKDFAGRIPESATTCSSSSSTSYREILHQDKISFLMSSQAKSKFYKVEDGLMFLLKRCLEKQPKDTISVISGYIDHFESVSQDAGWGCGWRNIQMLTSHLLAQRKDVRDVLFGGSGFVPDVPSLQRWLEIAWERGFDVPGSESFKCKIYGTKKWIGTTECAALLRSFGLWARVVDFDTKLTGSCDVELNSNKAGARKVEPGDGDPKGKKRMKEVIGPMDKFLSRRSQGLPELSPSLQNGHNSAKLPNIQSEHHLLVKQNDCPKLTGPHVLASWVWKYFFSEISSGSSNSNVFVSLKTPLYFQHDGHSRTIVGIQMQKRSSMPDQYTLLVLDPSQRTAALEKALKENSGWQKLIKRGLHTLGRPQYQLCYVDPGIAVGKEWEQLKTISSVLVKM